ncbi:MAG: M20/M25/M40 family metallo-hydrolase [Pseudomonadota bacterium]
MLIPGLCGYEGRVRSHIKSLLRDEGVTTKTDRLGNLIATIEGDATAPSVMVVAHMDQLGFVVRAIEPDGFVRVERVGGVPERALASKEVIFQIGEGRDRPGVISNKSHHATPPKEKYQVVRYQDVAIDGGFSSAAEVRAAGIDIGTPIVYAPKVRELGEGRIGGPAVDDRAGCAVMLEVARHLGGLDNRPTVHFVFSTQEEFNLRGALVAAQALKPDIAIQIDLLLTGDSPDMKGRTEVRLGGGPGISLYSFHGRGTLNGTIPHPALPVLFERAAAEGGMPLQKSAQTGILTETSYLQLVDEGVAAIDIGFPCRYTHSSFELCDLGDLSGLAELLLGALGRVMADEFSLDRDAFEQ